MNHEVWNHQGITGLLRRVKFLAFVSAWKDNSYGV